MATKWNKNLQSSILKSAEVAADIRRRGERVGAAAGPGFVVDFRVGKNRARASVGTTDIVSRRRNAKNNTLIRALEAGRGG